MMLHSMACWWYWVARIKGFSDETWLGQNYDWVGVLSITGKYVYCLYFVVTTFATVGYGDIHAYTIPEIIMVMCIMFCNMVRARK